ncbi:MAG TPA: ABC transporter ATP-binding protein [Bacteroidota bacterium]|nr:ABC transporter ATP-binding protein [Bacteroidota bacterium]
MQHITKHFGHVLANHDVDFHVSEGEIHALVGENGAGKSTLMHILYGLYQPDSGSIAIREHSVSIPSPSQAIGLGIGMVHQHFMLIPPLTVLENIILGNEPVTGVGILDLAHAEEQIKTLLERYHVDVDLHARIETLSVGIQQRVEILKLLYRNANILILDEPTPVLTPQETDALFETLHGLQAQGKTIILITHKLHEVMAISNSVTVMRRGKVIATCPTTQTSHTELSRQMVGHELALLPPLSGEPSHEPGLVLEGISALNDRHLPALRDVSLSIAKGEILGIAAVEGNGQSELVEVITGIRKPTEGRIIIDGINASSADQMPPISHIPEDRQKRGLVLDFTLKENLLLGRQHENAFHGMLLFHDRSVEKFAETTLRTFDVRPPDSRRRCRNLSGGNQQKVVIGREMTKDSHLIVAAHPTRGLDIGAIDFVHRTLLKERSRGKSILLVSSDLDELMTLSDRIEVMFGGRIVLTRKTRETTLRELGQYMTGTASS